jgi:cytochrome c5
MQARLCYRHIFLGAEGHGNLKRMEELESQRRKEKAENKCSEVQVPKRGQYNKDSEKVRWQMRERDAALAAFREKQAAAADEEKKSNTTNRATCKLCNELPVGGNYGYCADHRTPGESGSAGQLFKRRKRNADHNENERSGSPAPLVGDDNGSSAALAIVAEDLEVGNSLEVDCLEAQPAAAAMSSSSSNLGSSSGNATCKLCNEAPLPGNYGYCAEHRTLGENCTHKRALENATRNANRLDSFSTNTIQSSS